MTNFIISSPKRCEHYFFKPYEGICKRERLPGGSWKEHESVLGEGLDVFAVYYDKSDAIHIICIDAENRLIYAVQKGETSKKYVLTTLGSDIFVSDMRLYNAGGRLNLLYSALYNGEIMLIHCILGNHAKPSCVDTLETSHFFIYNHKVYYTNSKGDLGFVSLEDEKPCGFNKLYEDAHCPSISQFAGNEFLIFTHEARLFINGEEILYDSRMEMPTCIRGNDRLYVMWKSGNFVRYITTFNGGITWSEPMRFVSSGNAICSYILQEGNSFNCYYGYHTKKDLTLLGVPDIFSKSRYSFPTSEIEKLRTTLDLAQKEIKDAKNEILKLNRIIEALKDVK